MSETPREQVEQRSTCVRVSTADLSPLQIAESQAGRLGRWICEDSLGFVEFPSQEEADDALVAAVWADRTEVTDAQADAAFRYADRHPPTEEDRESLARIKARVLSSPPPVPSPATTPAPTKMGVRVCGVDCHPGDAHCNNYCRDPKVKQPPSMALVMKRGEVEAWVPAESEDETCPACGMDPLDRRGEGEVCLVCVPPSAPPAPAPGETVQEQEQEHEERTEKSLAPLVFQPQEPMPKGESPMPTDKVHRGLYAKFTVTRTDGTDAPGGKHEGCDYFTLDLTHDEYAAPALLAYADACRAKYPALARDLRQEANAIRLRRCTGLFPSPGRGAV